MEQADADIVCFGHIHKPYHGTLNSMEEIKNHFRHTINIGSGGKPKDDDIRGCYLILTINEYSNTKVAESIGVEFIRFDYDVEKATKAVEDRPLPNEYADMLRKGY